MRLKFLSAVQDCCNLLLKDGARRTFLKMNKVVLGGFCSLFLIVFSSVSCEREKEIKTLTVSIRASISEDVVPSKTSIDKDGKMFWTDEDDFYVYSINDIIGGDSPSNFESEIDSPVSSAVFTGNLEIDENETYFALYPGYNHESSFWGDEADGSMNGEFIGYLSPDQYESYDSESNFDFSKNMMLAAISEGSVGELFFQNVLSGLKFSFSEAGYTEVSLRGNNGELIAGEFSLDFEAITNHPIITPLEGSDTNTEVIISSSGFIVGDWLYLLIFPKSFENGITISFKKNGIAAGSIVIESPIEFKRGVWKKVACIDKKIDYSDFDDNGNIVFADEVVKRLCVNNWDNNGDGEISLSEAEAVADLGSVFKEKKNIDTFNELRFFTGLTSIPDYAFSKSSIRQLIIPDTVISVGNYSFNQCSNLQGELVLPECLSSIGNYAFAGCSNLAGDLDLTNVTTVGVGAFSGCTGLQGRLFLGNGITIIKNQTFYNCGFSGSLVIPDSVAEIGERAFSGCSNFRGSLTLGNGVTKIGIMAFVCGDVYTYYCPFDTLICRRSVPASLSKNGGGRVSDVWPFSETKSGTTAMGSSYNYKAPGTIYVPIGSAESYENGWSWASSARVLEMSM